MTRLLLWLVVCCLGGASIHDASGHLLTAGHVTTAYHYQANNRVDVAQQYVSGGRNISHRTYGYYPDGQMSWFNKTADGSANTFENDRGDAYAYQADGQLSYVAHESQHVYNGSPNAQGDSWAGASDTPQRANAYGYDAAGNRTYANESRVLSQLTAAPTCHPGRRSPAFPLAEPRAGFASSA